MGLSSKARGGAAVDDGRDARVLPITPVPCNPLRSFDLRALSKSAPDWADKTVWINNNKKGAKDGLGF